MAEVQNTKTPREGPRAAGESLTEGSGSESLSFVCPTYTGGATDARTVAAGAATNRRLMHSQLTSDSTHDSACTTPTRLPPRDAAGRFIKPPRRKKIDKDSDDFSSGEESVIPSGTKRPRGHRVTPGVQFEESDPEFDGEPLRKGKPSARGKIKKTGSTRARSESRRRRTEEEDALTRELQKALGTDAPMSAATSDPEADEAIDFVIPDLRSLGPEELRALGGKASAAILYVAAKSGHLKGTFVKRLKKSANLYTCVVAELTSRQEDEENQRLRAQLARQQRRIEALEAELKAHRVEFAKFKVAAATSTQKTVTTTPSNSLDSMIQELQVSLTRTLGDIIDVRMVELEDRLLPPRSYRLPVAADQKTKKAPMEASATQRVSTSAPPPTQGKKSQTSVVTHAGPSTIPGEESWASVARRKPPKKKPVQKAAQHTPAAATQAEKETGKKPKKKRKPRKRKRFVERPPAVVLTIPQDLQKRGVTYARVLERASYQVDLASLGIAPGIRFRRSATGARVLQFPKTQCAQAVQKLADELDRVLDGVVEVRVPQTLVGLRVSGLDDTVSQEDVAAAIEKATGCAATNVKVGPVKEGPSRMGTALVRCPVGAAKKLAEAGRLLVGWSSARVRVLERRPMRCFKCLSLGHTGAVCPSGVDRSGLCFRCGGEGHKAVDCRSATLRCAVCAAANRPSKHVSGGRNCIPPKIRPKRAASSASAPTDPPPGAEEDEEEEAAMNE